MRFKIMSSGKHFDISLKVFNPSHVLILICALFFNCEENLDYQTDLNDPQLFNNAMKNLTDVIVYDIFSPPVASRVYLYPTLASYTIVQKSNPSKYNNLEEQIKDFEDAPEPLSENINFNLAAIHAFYSVAKSLVFSEEKLFMPQQELYDDLKENGIPDEIFEASIDYGNKIANHILDFANRDLYKQTRTYPQYILREEPKFWKPTPPNYMQGIEPHWNKIRTMVIDSANQFAPKPPIEFNLSEGSPFMKQLMEVYEKGGKNNCKGEEIAKFWDCNPYVALQQGHTMFANKKITPGGHWIGITSIATKQTKCSFDETVNAFTNVSIALFDGFISCWDEKWKTLVVRPETVINNHIDENWKPFLQTPPFPEYTSGHSVISASAAITLTNLFGDNFSFVDTTELDYGLPSREFSSFIQASEEAALSRLYGGIHYDMAIKEGFTQGQQVGYYIVENLKTMKNQ